MLCHYCLLSNLCVSSYPVSTLQLPYRWSLIYTQNTKIFFTHSYDYTRIIRKQNTNNNTLINKLTQQSHCKTDTNKEQRNLASKRPAEKGPIRRAPTHITCTVAIPLPTRAPTCTISQTSESFPSTFSHSASQWARAWEKGLHPWAKSRGEGGEVLLFPKRNSDYVSSTNCTNTCARRGSAHRVLSMRVRGTEPLFPLKLGWMLHGSPHFWRHFR